MILADHEGLYEWGRLLPAISVAVAMILVSATLVMFVAGRVGRGWYRAPAGPMVLAAVAATLVAGVLGAVPRDTADGYVICGPVLHLARSDSELCDGVLDPLLLWVRVSIGVAAAAGVVAMLLALVARPVDPAGRAQQ